MESNKALESRFGIFYKLSDICRITRQSRDVVSRDIETGLLPSGYCFGTKRTRRWSEDQVEEYLSRALKRGEKTFIKK